MTREEVAVRANELGLINDLLGRHVKDKEDVDVDCRALVEELMPYVFIRAKELQKEYDNAS